LIIWLVAYFLLGHPVYIYIAAEIISNLTNSLQAS